MVSYIPLFKLLIEKKMTKTELREATGMSTATLAKLSKDDYVSLSTIDSICKVLNCKIEDVVEIV